MTTRVRIMHGGGPGRIGVFHEGNGEQVAVLEKDGDEFSDHVYDGQQFSTREIASDTAADTPPVGPTPNAPNPDGDPVTDEAINVGLAHDRRKMPGER